MHIKVNGEQIETKEAETLLDLLGELGIDAARVAAIELNRVIVRRPDFPTFKLNDGDEVEILNFVGGG